MVDVSEKPISEREASAEATVIISAEAYEAIGSGAAPKGDVLAAARLAGIMAAKKTADLIPLCHPIVLAKVGVDFEMLDTEKAIRIVSRVRTSGQTGVEMEALTAASVAALTIYDMIKAVDRQAQIKTIRLLAKSGGASGSYVAPSLRPTVKPKARPRVAKAAVLMEAAATRQSQRDRDAEREAFRSFMTSRRLRASEWAKHAGISPSLIYAYLTGRSRALTRESVERLARAARVRVEDLFR